MHNVISLFREHKASCYTILKAIPLGYYLHDLLGKMWPYTMKRNIFEHYMQRSIQLSDTYIHTYICMSDIHSYTFSPKPELQYFPEELQNFFMHYCIMYKGAFYRNLLNYNKNIFLCRKNSYSRTCKTLIYKIY